MCGDSWFPNVHRGNGRSSVEGRRGGGFRSGKPFHGVLKWGRHPIKSSSKRFLSMLDRETIVSLLKWLWISDALLASQELIGGYDTSQDFADAMELLDIDQKDESVHCCQ
jgi:hypothetical protein